MNQVAQRQWHLSPRQCHIWKRLARNQACMGFGHRQRLYEHLTENSLVRDVWLLVMRILFGRDRKTYSLENTVLTEGRKLQVVGQSARPYALL